MQHQYFHAIPSIHHHSFVFINWKWRLPLVLLLVLPLVLLVGCSRSQTASDDTRFKSVWIDNYYQEIQAIQQDSLSNQILPDSCPFPLSILKTPRLLSMAAIRDTSVAQTCAQMMITPISVCDTNLQLLAIDESVDTLLERQLFAQAMTLATNPKRLVPISHQYLNQLEVVQVGHSNWAFEHFSSRILDYSAADFKHIPLSQLDDPNYDNIIINNNQLKIIVLADKITNQSFLETLRKLSTEQPIIILNIGNLQHLKSLNHHCTVIQIYEQTPLAYDFAAQLIFGGMRAMGQLPLHISDDFKYGQGETNTPIIRLNYEVLANTSLNEEKLTTDSERIVQRAIRKKAFPGCRVLVAQSGSVVFDRAFGYFTYQKKQPVQRNTLYDLASITKATATTLSIMKLYEMGKIQSIEDKVQTYLPHSEGTKSRIQGLKLRYLLTHRSGLPISFPILDFVRMEDRTSDAFFEYFSHSPTDVFSVKVTDNLYTRPDMQTEVWKRVQASRLHSRKRFEYSDLNFFILQKIVRQLAEQPFEDYLNTEFYQPLGLHSLTFNPSRSVEINRIAPTENDQKWREEQLQGYVHDEAAALLGGIAGHAGLFGRANDLAIIGQMLLHRGNYGGVQLLDSTTVDYFTANDYGNHRGLGFDHITKKGGIGCYYGAGERTFGHSGYTGTSFWIDPDRHLVYVFLSNRVYPNKKNEKINQLKTRMLVHRAIYKALK